MNIQNLPDVLAERAATIGHHPVYHYFAPRMTTPTTLTYRELHDHTCMLAVALHRFGLRGKNALLMYPPGLEFIEAFFGCMRGNVSAVPMYIPPGTKPDTRLRSIVATADIAAVLTVKAKLAQVRSFVSELFPDRDCLIICTDD
jgi:acyl-CoA synthetase (AMP-forming)/AMP-acid ligase II